MIRNSFNAAWDRWANLHPFVRFLILSVVAVAIAFFAVRPAYHVFKSWRLGRNLVAARQAVDVLDMSEARDLSLSVLRAGDPRIEAFRILEKSTDALRDPIHGQIAQALIFHPKSTDEDRLNGFRGIVNELPLGLLGQTWAGLPEGCRRDPRFVTVFADRLMADHRSNEAASVLLAVPEAARTTAVKQGIARLLIGSGKTEGYDEAQRLIAAGFPPDGVEISGWLDVLEKIPVESLHGDLLVPVRAALEKPTADAAARRALMLARLDYAANPAQRETIVDQAVARWKDSDPEAVACFLADLGQHQRLLATFPADLIPAHPGLFPRLLDAMARTAAWQQVAPLLDVNGTRLDKFEELARRAVAAAKTGDHPTQVQAWSEAVSEAKSGRHSNAFLKLHQIAADAGMDEQARQAMLEAIHLSRGPLPLYADLKPLLVWLSEQGSEKTLLEICAIYLAFEPGNPVLLTQYAYLASLNGLADPKLIVKAMQPLAKAYPRELPIQCVLATAYLCAGQPEMAAAILDPLGIDPDRLSPGYRAAFLTIQVLNHRISKDDPRITGFPWKSLQASERKKFSELIAAAEK